MDNAVVPADDDLRFERYLRDSFAGLVARLRSSFSERVAAEDVVQEALIRAWQLDARGERIRFLEPWMNAVATNLAARGGARSTPRTGHSSRSPAIARAIPRTSFRRHPLRAFRDSSNSRLDGFLRVRAKSSPFTTTATSPCARSQVGSMSAREPSNARCMTPAPSFAAWWDGISNSNDIGGRP